MDVFTVLLCLSAHLLSISKINNILPKFYLFLNYNLKFFKIKTKTIKKKINLK